MRSSSCQPPCEAVSWNSSYCFPTQRTSHVSLLVRLWVEMNSSPFRRISVEVSLLVRLWVEIWDNCRQFCTRIVSLLVRLWVEMYWDRYSFCPKRRQPPCEAVSWNVLNCVLLTTPFSQPPCEAVSWNILNHPCRGRALRVSLLVRLWVEILSVLLYVYKVNVSLLVRLWVEMFPNTT